MVWPSEWLNSIWMWITWEGLVCLEGWGGRRPWNCFFFNWSNKKSSSQKVIFCDLNLWDHLNETEGQMMWLCNWELFVDHTCPDYSPEQFKISQLVGISLELFWVSVAFQNAFCYPWFACSSTSILRSSVLPYSAQNFDGHQFVPEREYLHLAQTFKYVEFSCKFLKIRYRLWQVDVVGEELWILTTKTFCISLKTLGLKI